MEDQIALLDALGIERAVWVGASVGGPIALRAALRHPDRVSGLVLIATQAGSEHPARLPMYETFGEQVATAGWTEDALRGTAFVNFGPNAPAALTERWIEHWRAQPVDDIREIMHSLTRRESLLDRLGEVRAPAWVAYGEEDGAALQRDEVEQMVAGLPNMIEFVMIPGAGHTPTLQQPDAVTALISRALTGTR
jgi:pimeloyl-ACP methyl ester carboxylesterase